MDLREPWWPYDAIAWVAKQIQPQAQVFEYGGGGSTLWLADKGATVTVVEHDAAWRQKLNTALSGKAKVLRRDIDITGKLTSTVVPGFFDNYVSAIDEEPDDSLDLVIIDGRARIDCVRHARLKVRPGGLLLLDDTQRGRYQPAIKLLSDWKRHDFTGLKPGNPLPTQTSVWRRPT